VKRAEYLRRHIRQVQRAVRDGVNVAGYVCWSITTNHEWGFPHTAQTDFGLFAIDLDGDPELRRVRTPDAELYAQIIARRSV
jgi:beta-glucosidase/6-phospho-beta-glucosidase/beta-galactosidase